MNYFTVSFIKNLDEHIPFRIYFLISSYRITADPCALHPVGDSQRFNVTRVCNSHQHFSNKYLRNVESSTLNTKVKAVSKNLKLKVDYLCKSNC